MTINARPRSLPTSVGCSHLLIDLWFRYDTGVLLRRCYIATSLGKLQVEIPIFSILLFYYSSE